MSQALCQLPADSQYLEPFGEITGIHKYKLFHHQEKIALKFSVFIQCLVVHVQVMTVTGFSFCVNECKMKKK